MQVLFMVISPLCFRKRLASSIGREDRIRPLCLLPCWFTQLYVPHILFIIKTSVCVFSPAEAQLTLSTRSLSYPVLSYPSKLLSLRQILFFFCFPPEGIAHCLVPCQLFSSLSSPGCWHRQPSLGSRTGDEPRLHILSRVNKCLSNIPENDIFWREVSHLHADTQSLLKISVFTVNVDVVLSYFF